MRYSIDTSALIEPWRDLYPPRIFGGFWQRYEQLIASGAAIATEEVYEELKKRDDDLLAWAKERRTMFVELGVDIQEALHHVLSVNERIIGSGRGRSPADPWVIALAKARDLTVVTMEKPNGNPRKPKVPDVCQELGVRCVNIIGLLDQEGWRFAS